MKEFVTTVLDYWLVGVGDQMPGYSKTDSGFVCVHGESSVLLWGWWLWNWGVWHGRFVPVRRSAFVGESVCAEGVMRTMVVERVVVA